MLIQIICLFAVTGTHTIINRLKTSSFSRFPILKWNGHIPLSLLWLLNAADCFSIAIFVVVQVLWNCKKELKFFLKKKNFWKEKLCKFRTFVCVHRRQWIESNAHKTWIPFFSDFVSLRFSFYARLSWF